MWKPISCSYHQHVDDCPDEELTNNNNQTKRKSSKPEI